MRAVVVRRLPCLLRALSSCVREVLVAWDAERLLVAPSGDGGAGGEGHLRESLQPSRLVAALADLGLACAAADAAAAAGAARAGSAVYSAYLRCMLDAVVTAQPLTAEVAASALVAVASARPAGLGLHACTLLRELVTTVACARAARAMCALLGRVLRVVPPGATADTIAAVPRRDATMVPWRCARAALMCRWLPQLRASPSAAPATHAAARAVVADLAIAAVALCGGCEGARPRAVGCGLDLAAALAGVYDVGARGGSACVLEDDAARRLLACGVRALQEFSARPVRDTSCVAGASTI